MKYKYRNNFYVEVEEKGQTDFPPSKVTGLGFSTIGEKIRTMLDHGKLVLDTQAEYEFDDYNEDKEGWETEKDVKLDPSNDVSLDKMDALEMRDDVLSKILESSENVKKHSKEVQNKNDDISSLENETKAKEVTE